MVSQWIGTKITDYSTSISNFILTTIKDGFDFEESFYDEIVDKTLNSTQPVPHVYVRPGTKGATNWIDLEKKTLLNVTFAKTAHVNDKRVKFAFASSVDI